MQRQFKRLPVKDSRDQDYPLDLLTATRIKRRWRSNWYADQGATPHCVGYAGARWLECEPICQFLDPDGLYLLAQQNDEWDGEDYDGTSVRGMFRVLRLLGLAPEYRWATTVEQIIGWVSERGPVLLGVNWYRGMMSPDDQGVIVPRGGLLGGHAILIDEVNTRQELFGLNNTWGRDWGLDGRCHLHFDHVARLLREDGEAGCGVEVVPRPNTRRRSRSEKA